MIGTSGGSGIDFHNQTGARVEGNLIFAAGDDNLFFFANSVVTGSINGGGGHQRPDAGGRARLERHARRRARELPDADQGRPRPLDDQRQPDRLRTRPPSRLGTLALTGNNTGYTAGVTIDPLGTLEARAQSLPTQTNPASNLNNIRNNGLAALRADRHRHLCRPDRRHRAGSRRPAPASPTLAPSAAAGNTYAGGTTINEGTLAVAADSALGAAAGGLSFNGGTLRTTASFAMARPGDHLARRRRHLRAAAGTLTDNGVHHRRRHADQDRRGHAGARPAPTAYAGGTQINGGAVQVGADANLGAAAGPLGFNGGTLRTHRELRHGPRHHARGRRRHLRDRGGTITHTGASAGRAAHQDRHRHAGLRPTLRRRHRINGGSSRSPDANLGAAGSPRLDRRRSATASFAMNRATSCRGGGTFETTAAHSPRRRISGPAAWRRPAPARWS